MKLICKGCRAEVTSEALDYAEDNDFFPPELEHQVDCGCYGYDESLGADACKCEFVKPSTIKKLQRGKLQNGKNS